MKSSYLLLILSSLFISPRLVAIESIEIHDDPHYSDIGFFDIHICNWPQRPHFFKVLFSSEKYDDIAEMTVYTPDNQSLITLDQSKYHLLKRKNKPDKKVFMLDIDVPEHASTGWYKIEVTTHDGKTFQAKDYVIMAKLEKISKMSPANDGNISQLPLTLKWLPVPGSQYYQAFIRDEWTGDLIYSSKLLDTPYVTIPEDKLEAGGYYSWSVHARDTNEHILLGDFHMGSISKKLFFTVAE